ncbi:MAG TPA: HAD family hydrolase [Sphaerochaeta sp.]|nr:HAD family hydrolase [Sphaerochaeta sp.]
MGIAFDLDGTLVDSTPDLLAAINAVLAKYNLPLSDKQENLTLAGGGLMAMFSSTVEKRIPTSSVEKKEQLISEMLGLYMLDPATLTVAFPGVLSLLEAIQKQGTPICVISNKLAALTEKILHTLFPSVCFSKVYGIDSGFEPKPDSSSLLDFKRSLPTGEELIYVGDTEIDYKTAHGVADRVYLATWGYRGLEALQREGLDEHLMVSDTAQLACALGVTIS